MSAALSDPTGLPYPGLARVAASVAHYGALMGTDQLSADIANVKLFSPARKAAFRSLFAAIEALADDGPARLDASLSLRRWRP